MECFGRKVGNVGNVGEVPPTTHENLRRRLRKDDVHVGSLRAIDATRCDPQLHINLAALERRNAKRDGSRCGLHGVIMSKLDAPTTRLLSSNFHREIMQRGDLLDDTPRKIQVG